MSRHRRSDVSSDLDSSGFDRERVREILATPPLSPESDERVWRRVRAEFRRQRPRLTRSAGPPQPAGWRTFVGPSSAVAWGAAAVAVVACTAMAWYLSAPAPLMLRRVVGNVAAGNQGQVEITDSGRPLAAGSRVEAPPGATADISDGERSFDARLHNGALSVVRTPPRGRAGRFQLLLESGELWVRTRPEFHGDTLEVVTADLSATIRGTAFRVVVDPLAGTRVEVAEGVVDVTTSTDAGAVPVRARKLIAVEDGRTEIRHSSEDELAWLDAGFRAVRAPSLILGIADYFMPSDNIDPEMGLALGWDADRSFRIVGCVDTGRRLTLRLVQGPGQPESIVTALKRVAALERAAVLAQAPYERRERLLEAAEVLLSTVAASPDPVRDGAMLCYAAHLQCRGAERADLALATLERAADVARGTPLEPVTLAAQAILLEESMGRRAAAREVFGEILRRFPVSPEARLTRQRLGGDSS